MVTNQLDISEARQNLANLGETLSETHVVWVKKHGKSLFAIVDKDWMEAVLETLEVLEDPDSLRVLQASLRDIREGRLHDHDELKEDLLHESGREDRVDRRGKEKRSRTTH